MKVQTTTCKDNNNSKSKAAACVKFEININDINTLYSVHKVSDF